MRPEAVPESGQLLVEPLSLRFSLRIESIAALILSGKRIEHGRRYLIGSIPHVAGPWEIARRHRAIGDDQRQAEPNRFAREPHDRRRLARERDCHTALGNRFKVVGAVPKPLEPNVARCEVSVHRRQSLQLTEQTPLDVRSESRRV
jgi:hypothetical protein